MSDLKIKCSVGILTLNSAAFLERCLKSLEGFDEIIVSDGGSTDATLDIARTYGCTIMQQERPGKPIEDFARERNRMLDAAQHDWYLTIDSDEYLSPGLKEEIRKACSIEPPAAYVYRVPWKIVSEDGSIIYRSFKPYYQHRFFNRRSGARFERKVHEHVVFDEKAFPPGTFTNPWYVPLDIQLDFSVYKEKVDRRIRVMVEQNPPRNLLAYIRRLVIDPSKSIGKQLIKLVYLRAKYPARELTPLRYELYKLYSQWVYIQEATYQYGMHLRSVAKTGTYLLMYGVRSAVRLFNKKPEVAVLMYHAVDSSGWKHSIEPDQFDRQVAYLARTMHPVALGEVVAHATGEQSLPHKSVALTFDDGYADFFTTVLPILERYQVPATLFLTTDLSASTSSYATPRITEQQIRELLRHPLISIESHARTHRSLPSLTESEVAEELVHSKQDIQRITGREPQFFAYAYGARSPQVEAQAATTYKAAFSITQGLIAPGDDLYHLKRIQVDRTIGFLLFRLRLTITSDLHRWIVRLFRSIV